MLFYFPDSVFSFGCASLVFCFVYGLHAVYQFDREISWLTDDCRKVRLQMKDETEREEAKMRAAYADKLQKLQQDLEQQLTDEKAKIR